MYKIGIDVGGTFTDFVAVSDGDAPRYFKSPSTTADPSEAVVEGLGDVARSYGLPPSSCWDRPSWSYTAPRSRPIRWSSEKVRGSACSPPTVLGTCWRCARG